MTNDEVREELEFLTRMGLLEVDRSGPEPKFRKKRTEDMTEEARNFLDLLNEVRTKPVGNA